MSLDASTLFIVSVTVTGLLGLFLVFLWIQDRQIRALGWWGAAYLLGGSAVGLWMAATALPMIPVDLASSLLFAAAGIIWGGARVFHGRKPLWPAMLAGSGLWLAASRLPFFADEAAGRVVLTSVIITTYIVMTAAEMQHERRGPGNPPWRRFGIPALHGIVFLSPMLVAGLPRTSIVASEWFTVFAIETLLYVVGTAFIVVVMAHERSVTFHKTAAITDPLTGLFNRRGFVEHAPGLIETAACRNQPVGVLMFDLDHFKSINDRFGHAAGDDALRLFGEVMRANLRTSDLAARLGGEEFAAIVPGGPEVALSVGERMRVAFQEAGVEIAGFAMAATVSVGAVCERKPGISIETLLGRADETLYRAKAGGRNRVMLFEETPTSAEENPALAA
jgi:diguanylate cyclase (GGDEF)-like protein